MPREKINDMTQPEWHAEVSWRRKPHGDDQGSAEGHVQLATVNRLSPFEFPDADTGDHFEAGERFDGWRVTLDEAGIDRLIKALHKAKRQAFGGALRFHNGGLVSSGVSVAIEGDECILWLAEGDTSQGKGTCMRDDHDGRACRTEGVDFHTPAPGR